MVPGDLCPTLVTAYAGRLAKPVTAIYNRINETKKWPHPWLIEYVTVIPKGRSPTEPGECRNISCTNLLSKVYELSLIHI